MSCIHEIVGEPGERFPTIYHENNNIRSGKTLGARVPWTQNELSALRIIVERHVEQKLEFDKTKIYDDLIVAYPDFQRGQLGVDAQLTKIFKDVQEQSADTYWQDYYKAASVVEINAHDERMKELEASIVEMQAEFDDVMRAKEEKMEEMKNDYKEKNEALTERNKKMIALMEIMTAVAKDPKLIENVSLSSLDANLAQLKLGDAKDNYHPLQIATPFCEELAETIPSSDKKPPSAPAIPITQVDNK